MVLTYAIYSNIVLAAFSSYVSAPILRCRCRRWASNVSG